VWLLQYYDVVLPGKGRTGDYDIFVDDDGSAYHVRTGFDVVKLNANFTGPDSHMSSFTTPKASEGPVMFKRNGKYYVMSGTGCCACIGGSTIYVQEADSLAGPWNFKGDVGSNPTPFECVMNSLPLQ
jgi:beta-xylosidase